MEDYFLPNFTQAPNYFFDVLLNQLSSTEVHVMCAIIRKTYGWHKAEDKISFSQLTKATGLALSTVQNAIKKLVDKGIVVSKIVEGVRAYSFLVEKKTLESQSASKEPLPENEQNKSYIPNNGIDTVQNNSYIPDSGMGVYRIPVTPPLPLNGNTERNGFLNNSKKSAREAGAASLQKIGFDYEAGVFSNAEAVKEEFEGKYKQRLEARGMFMEDVYFDACDLIKKGLKVERYGSFLESFYRDRAFPWIRNEMKKKHEATLTAEQIKQGRENYEFYCTLPYNKLLEFRDLHIKVKNRDYECYVYANPEEFKKFMDKAFGESYVQH
jgi:phage replication O-like protein O